MANHWGIVGLVCGSLKKRGLLPLFSLHCMLAPECCRD
jgi:hypothetical protein